MFTESKNEITFEVVENFCSEFSEGIRVEYKREINHVPKIVSSFANTLGGIFIIGVEANKTNNEVIIPIPGIPKQNGLEEGIQQSALTGIYPAVIPDVIKIVDVPDTENVVVVVRVNESVQAPHAIQNSTRTYIRTGSITQPYELADMDRIKYMFKRREDSQMVTRQILDRIEERTKRLNCTQDVPSITVIARPVFPYRPVISTSDIYDELGNLYNPRRVTGGVCSILTNCSQYEEFNEYGIAYRKSALPCSDNKEIEYLDVKSGIVELIEQVRRLYKACEYLGNIEVSVQLRHVFDTGLLYNGNKRERSRCLDSDILVSKQCFPRDLQDGEKRKHSIEDLILQLLWGFNLQSDYPLVGEKVRQSLRD